MFVCQSFATVPKCCFIIMNEFACVSQLVLHTVSMLQHMQCSADAQLVACILDLYVGMHVVYLHHYCTPWPATPAGMSANSALTSSFFTYALMRLKV
jgi:hypothetical protein